MVTLDKRTPYKAATKWGVLEEQVWVSERIQQNGEADKKKSRVLPGDLYAGNARPRASSSVRTL